MKTHPRIVAPLLAALLTLTTVSPAFSADGAQKAAAEQLFRDAKARMDAGQFGEACPKLEQSLKLDPSDGTLLRLAYCYEHSGRLASAWARYGESLGHAKAAGNTERIAFCEKSIADLEPRLSRVTVLIPNAPSGVDVQWDGASFVYGSAVPVDGGSHVLSVSAPGKKAWQTRLEIAIEKDSKTVTVPALDDAAEVASPGSSSGSGAKTGAIIAFSAAGVFAAGAIVSRIVMGGEKDAYFATCAEMRTFGCDNPDGKASVRRWETLSFVSGGLALAALGVGIGFVVSGSSNGEPKTGLIVSPTVGASNGLSLTGAF